MHLAARVEPREMLPVMLSWISPFPTPKCRQRGALAAGKGGG